MKQSEHPILWSIWMKHKQPITMLYIAAVATYIAIGLTLGWFT